jgi:hypothetical protein
VHHVSQGTVYDNVRYVPAIPVPRYMYGTFCTLYMYRTLYLLAGCWLLAAAAAAAMLLLLLLLLLLLAAAAAGCCCAARRGSRGSRAAACTASSYGTGSLP